MKVKFVMPDYVIKVARILAKEGYSCYLVGGALRDVVLNIQPDDFDCATDATPEVMLNIFPKAVSTGAKFGMVSALISGADNEVHEVQVTTFRSEENYIDGRWPSKVTFVKEIDKDLGRRDFTFNAMALDLTKVEENSGEQEWEVYDPFDGMSDLNNKIVRAVGTPIERFKEDGLRSMRACRLASQLGFTIEKDTHQAIKDTLSVAALVSAERVRDEFVKIVKNSPVPSVGIELMRETGLLKLFVPELLEGFGVEQKLFHADDVYHHLLKTCDSAPKDVRIAALFHDIGKPRKDMGNGHFYGHDEEGAKMSQEIMTRLRFSNAEINRTVALVANHMFYFPHMEDDMTQEEKNKIKEKEWSDSAVRRFIVRVGEENLEDLFEVRIADAASNFKTAFKPEEISHLQERISEVRAKDMALKISDLKITGDDLMRMGIPKGPKIGRILSILLEKVLDDPSLNTAETLLKISKDIQ